MGHPYLFFGLNGLPRFFKPERILSLVPLKPESA